MSNFGSSQGPS